MYVITILRRLRNGKRSLTKWEKSKLMHDIGSCVKKKNQRLCEKYTNNGTHKVTLHWYKSLNINERKVKKTFTWHHFTT